MKADGPIKPIKWADLDPYMPSLLLTSSTIPSTANNKLLYAHAHEPIGEINIRNHHFCLNLQLWTYTDFYLFDAFAFWNSEIIAELPDKPQSTLSHHKAKFLGHLPGNRDEYDPSIILSKSQKGARVIALGMFKFTFW